jgi:hypothetical protein
MSLLERQLQAELHTLKTEAGKKYPKVREGAERADRCLREIIDAGASSDAEVAAAVRRLGEMEEMLNPALLALETKNPKFMSLGWGYITRLATYDALAATTFAAVAQALKASLEGGGDEHVVLRVLQCIGACLQAPNILCSRGCVCVLVDAALAVFSSKASGAVIANTASATLRQGVATLFEYAEKARRASSAASAAAAAAAATTTTDQTEGGGGGDDDDARHQNGGNQNGGGGVESGGVGYESVTVAAAVLADLCILAVGGAPQHLQLQTKQHPSVDLLCLDVVDTILRYMGAYYIIKAHAFICTKNTSNRQGTHIYRMLTYAGVC